MTAQFKDVIAERPMSAFQWRAVALCVLLNVLDGFDVLVMAFTGRAVSAEWGLTATQLGLLLSAGLVGMGIGTLFVAPWADRLGRRPVTLACMVVITVGMRPDQCGAGAPASVLGHDQWFGAKTAESGTKTRRTADQASAVPLHMPGQRPSRTRSPAAHPLSAHATRRRAASAKTGCVAQDGVREPSPAAVPPAHRRIPCRPRTHPPPALPIDGVRRPRRGAATTGWDDRMGRCVALT